jgi:hypothetical protein
MGEYTLLLGDGIASNGLLIEENWHSIKIDGAYNTDTLEINDEIEIITPTSSYVGICKRIWKNTIYVEKDNFYDITGNAILWELESRSYKLQKDTNKPIDDFDITLHVTDSIHISPHDRVKLFVSNDCKFDGYISTYNQTTGVSKAYGFINEMVHIPVKKKYTSQSIEYIIQDLVESYSTFTVSYDNDTTVIDRFYAAGYLWDVLQVLLGIRGYLTNISDNELKLVLPSTKIEGTVITDVSYSNAEKNTEQIANNVLVQGTTTEISTTETGTLSSETFFELTRIVSGSIKVTVDGVETTDFTVDDVGGGIIFDTAQTGTVVVEYTYDKPLQTRYIDLDSLTANGQRSTEYSNSLLDTEDKISDMGYNIISESGELVSTVKIETKDKYYQVGKTYSTYDKKYAVDDTVICTSYTLTNESGDSPVTATFSKNTQDIFNKYKEYDSAIKDLEALFKQDDPDTNYAVTNKTTLLETDTVTMEIDINVDNIETIQDNDSVSIEIITTATEIIPFTLGIGRLGINTLGG